MYRGREALTTCLIFCERFEISDWIIHILYKLVFSIYASDGWSIHDTLIPCPTNRDI